MPDPKTILEVAGREVTVTNPGKIVFPRTGHTKLDLIRYYLSVADGALRGVDGRPMVLKRFVHGAEGEAFFQKRAPNTHPDWIETVELSFPSGRTAEEVVVRDAAQLAWVVNLGCIDLNPHPVRAADIDHPDELRVDLDPVPGVGWAQIRDVAMVTRDTLASFGLTGWPKTSGSRGFHIYCRIEPRWSFSDVRRAAVALAREIERRAPEAATSKWWKEERHGVFIDYNQNAKDRTIASAYSVRPLPDARVSTPLTWEEVPDCEPEAFTLDTVPARFAEIGDPAAGMDRAVCSLEPLLELAGRDEAAGLPDAPWPPHYLRQEGEEPRVQPSKRRAGGASGASGGGRARGDRAAGGSRAGTGAGRGSRAGRGSSAGAGSGTGDGTNGGGGSGAGGGGGARGIAGGSGTSGPVTAGGSGTGGPVTGGGSGAGRGADSADPSAPSVMPSAPGYSYGASGRRRTTMPLIEIARAATKAEAMEGLERWKARHPEVWPRLEPADVLVDSMRGRSSTWTRIRLNLRNVPPGERPAQEALEVDYDPWAGA